MRSAKREGRNVWDIWSVVRESGFPLQECALHCVLHNTVK